MKFKAIWTGIKAFGSKIRALWLKFGRCVESKPVPSTIIMSVICVLLIEMMSRHSVVEGIVWAVLNPHLFLFEILIILVTLSLSLFFKRRVFAYTVILTFWLVLGFADFVMLFFRKTPFSFSDITVLSSVKSIIGQYLVMWQLIMIIICAILIVIEIILVFHFAPKWKRHPVRGGIMTVTTGLLLTYMIILFSAKGVLPDTIPNLVDAYDDYGFVTMYMESVFLTGISEPDEYSARSVKDIAEMLGIDDDEDEEENVSTGATEETPNIIFVQLESFFDPNLLEDVSYTINPVPFFTSLKEGYTSGYLYVPSFGAGTINTEFEIISGMDLDFFGPGEYPYKTVLRTTTCETIAYNLSELGYTSHLIHNHRGSFYSRNLVYPNLGFDTFTSIEYMQNIEKNSIGWAKDSMLTEEIQMSLESTEGQDFIYTISVQGHGSYPDEEDEDQIYYVRISDCGLEDWDDSDIAGFEYYLNQVYEMDQFLQDLTEMLEELDEPTVLVIYGDHLPDIDIESGDMSNDTLYATEYVIWSNFGLEKQDSVDLEAYQLTAYVQGLLGMDEGVLTKLHQLGDENENYLDDLEMLQYDMLYGDLKIYSGVSPYTATDMTMGTLEITITDCIYDSEERTLTVEGENFTKYSKVFVNNKQVASTKLVDSNTLLVEDIDCKEEDTIQVIQLATDEEHLSYTEEFYLLDIE